jgi:hypothetical protein
MVMRKSKAKLLQAVCLVVFVAMALIALVPAARSDGTGLGGTITGTGPISYLSPCNGATISGTVNFKGVVTVFEEQSQSQVFVFVTYNAPNQKGTDGNTYNAYGQAVAAFDTLAPIDVTGKGHYNLPMNLDYDVSTNNNALNFLAGTQATVDVDSNQRPKDVPDAGVNAVCGK